MLQKSDNDVFTNGWQFFDTMIVVSSDKDPLKSKF